MSQPSRSNSNSNNPEPLVNLLGNWRFQPSVSDEFNGTLDETRWQPFNPTWKGRAPGWFNPNNVVVENGRLNLFSRYEEPPANYPEQYHTYSTAFIRSRQQIRYGYLEARVHPADSITSSSFWLVHNSREIWNEIDVFELSQADGHKKNYHMNMHLFRKDGKNLPKTLSHPKRRKLNFNTSDRPFVASVLWDKDHITWYIDGKRVRKERNKHWHVPMWVQFDSETMGNWFGLPSPSNPRLPANFQVDYIRCWQRN